MSATTATAPRAWAAPAGPPRLDADAVHVWRLALDAPGAAARLEGTLSAEERARARRIRFSRDRDRFVVAHGLVRTILGRYLDAPPHRLQFRAGPWGKPALAGPDGGDDLRFNLAHADDLALLAVACGREVGVDVEVVRAERVEAGLVRRVLAPAAHPAWDALPPARRVAAFFAAWTAMEALVKATGQGLAQALEQGLAPPADVLRLGPVTGVTAAGRRWSLRPLDVGAGYAAALCAEGEGWRLACWRWSEA